MLSSFSRVWLFVTLGTVVHQAPLSMGFSGQEYWSGMAFPPPGDLPDPGTEPTSHVSCIGRQDLHHIPFKQTQISHWTGWMRERDGRLNDGQRWGWGLRDAERLLLWQVVSLQPVTPEKPLKTRVYRNALIRVEGMIRNCLQYPPFYRSICLQRHPGRVGGDWFSLCAFPEHLNFLCL